MTNNDGTNDIRKETDKPVDSFNNDSSWMNLIILMVLLSIFPSNNTPQMDWANVIKGAAKTIEEFEKAEEVKPDEV